MAKKSATQILAEQEYFRKHSIPFEATKTKLVKPKDIVERPKPQEGVVLGHTGSLKSFGIYVELVSNIFKPPLTYMNDREIVTKLLSYYEEVLNYIIKPEIMAEPVKLKDYLFSKYCHRGVCLAARYLFGVDITEREWLTSSVNQTDISISGYWYYSSGNIYTSKELVQCISFRVNKLQEILNGLE